MSALGIAIGVALALALTRVMSTFLFGVQPADPVTYAAVAIALAAIAMAATYLPAHRASTVDPNIALRSDI